MELISIGKFAKMVGVTPTTLRWMHETGELMPSHILKTQVENMKIYMYAKGYQFEIIEDIGSGINYKKKGLQSLLAKINNR